MATIPYQPTYTVQPKYGFRYGPSAFAPTVGTVAPPPVGLQGSQATPPPVMGTQQGSPAPAYYQDPFDRGGGKEGGQPDYRPVAQQLGYTQGQQHPMNVLNMLPGGTFITDAMGINDNPKYNYGKYGTYDYSGNVFGTQGRAFNPITGEAAQSYKDPGTWMGNWLGVGTEEGPLGPSSSYGKLRGAGENVFNSLFGSYDNSVYKPMDMYSGLDTNYFTPVGPMPAMQSNQGYMDFSSPGAKYTDRVESIYNPELTPAQVRAYRNQGMMLPGSLEGVNSVRAQIAKNTAIASATPSMMGMSEDDYDRLDGGTVNNPVTAEMLGFDNTMAPPAPPKGGSAVGYVQGTDTGDVFRDGVVDENGRPVSNRGTAFSVTDAYGNRYSLGGTKAENKAVLDMVNEIDKDAITGTSSEERGFVENVSADNYSDKDPGTVTDSKGQSVLGGKTNPYGDSFTKSVDKDDSGGGSRGTHCCTAAEKRGDMSLTEVKKLRAWHRKQSIVWQKGYDIWGKVIADHLVAKFKWQSDRVRDFYNHKIYGKRTLGSVYADVVIYPMSMIIGCGVLLSSFIIREKNNEAKKSF